MFCCVSGESFTGKVLIDFVAFSFVFGIWFVIIVPIVWFLNVCFGCVGGITSGFGSLLSVGSLLNQRG